MTSIIKVDTIQNKAGSTSLAANKLPDMLSGSSKSWCNFNGTGTVAIRDSFNVSSLTDQGTGGYHINFTSNMGNTDYVTTGYSNGHSATNNFYSNLYVALATAHSPVSATTASYTTMVVFEAGVGARDGSVCFTAVHGDLA